MVIMKECCENCRYKYIPRDRYKNKPEYWSCELSGCLCIEMVDDPNNDKCNEYEY